MIIDLEDYVAHYGTPRRSGRYPWGTSGWGDGGEDETPPRTPHFLDRAVELKRAGMSDADIAKAMRVGTVTELRRAKAIAKNQQRAADIAYVQRMADRGWSNRAIAERMGSNESHVRNLRKPGEKDKLDVLTSTSNMLRDEVKKSKFVDIGTGTNLWLSISEEKLNTAVKALRDEGYVVHNVQVDQATGKGKTTIKVLAPPGTTYWDVAKDVTQVKPLSMYSVDGGRNYTLSPPPKSADSRRIGIVYGSQGGSERDGVIYVRPGNPDYDLGGKQYAQVRIAVDGTHYLKGMAVYKNDLPKGVDLLFHTNKESTGNKLDAMKELSNDERYPFGAVTRPSRIDRDKDGNEVSGSVMNLVNAEGDWAKWAKSLSTQMLSKQAPALAQQQLDATYDSRKKSFDEIMSLTNPTVRKKMLEEFADDVDSAAVHLKAAALPRQATKVIMPVSSLKDDEIYAPHLNNGDRVALIRFPHGGKFEIPELTVNNRNREGRELLGTTPQDGVGINAKVAQRLSGADFDGDTVLVIPNNQGKVKSQPALEGLKGFDPQRAYPYYDGMKVMSEAYKQKQMGVVSNLITDMTIKGASSSELARAVRHSMVVIDAAKHKLNYRQSEKDNAIQQLKDKYQSNEPGSGGSRGGTTTLISASGKTSAERVDKRIPRPAAQGGPVDPKTGKKVFIKDPRAAYVDKDGVTKYRKEAVPKLALVDDANVYVSKPGTPMERIYADHSNRLKSMANQARKEAYHTKESKKSPSAEKAYANEVATLNAKLNAALKNAPLERQAQVLAQSRVKAALHANPEMGKDKQKKIARAEIEKARAQTGAGKDKIVFTPKEWAAVQAGAIAPSKLAEILKHADMDNVKQFALPKPKLLMTDAKTARAKKMQSAGYTLAEIAAQLGVSQTTLKDAIYD